MATKQRYELRWQNLTVEEKAFVQKVLSNGCGAKGGWVPVPNYRFEASCDRHDFAYWRGGNRVDRQIADDGFLKAMLKDAARLPLWRRWFGQLMARAYYRAVRMCGTKAFRYRPSPADRILLSLEMSRAARKGEAW